MIPCNAPEGALPPPRPPTPPNRGASHGGGSPHHSPAHFSPLSGVRDIHGEGILHPTPWGTPELGVWGIHGADSPSLSPMDHPGTGCVRDSWRGGGRESPLLLGPRTIMDRLGFPSSPWPHHPPQSCTMVPSREVVENIWKLRGVLTCPRDLLSPSPSPVVGEGLGERGLG